MPTVTVPFSELLRHPTKTTQQLAPTQAMRLSRRDAADLLLMYAEQAEAQGRALQVAGQLLADIAREHSELLKQLLPTVLPWMRFLPAHDADSMTREYIEMVEAAGSLNNLYPLTTFLDQWRHTAEIYADPELYRALTSDDLGDFGPVVKPDADER